MLCATWSATKSLRVRLAALSASLSSISMAVCAVDSSDRVAATHWFARFIFSKVLTEERYFSHPLMREYSAAKANRLIRLGERSLSSTAVPSVCAGPSWCVIALILSTSVLITPVDNKALLGKRKPKAAAAAAAEKSSNCNVEC